jgi:5-methylcytosine-specific restriction endonuclease McrA
VPKGITEARREQLRAAHKRYRESAHGKAKRAAYSRSEVMSAARERWRETPQGKEYVKTYRASEKRKAVLRKYYEEGNGRATIDRYHSTTKGRESLLRGVHKRRARMGMAVCDLTAAQWEGIKQAQNYRCLLCGEGKPLTRDHIVPLSKGGSHTAANVQALCRSCNSRKGNRA